MKTYEWHILDMPADMADGKPIELSVAGKRICLLRKGDAIYAFAAMCPHSGAPLCDGWLDPLGRLVCPLHKYRFDPANGRNTSGEGYKLFTYPIEVRDGATLVGFLPDAF